MTTNHVYTIFKAEVPEGAVEELRKVAAYMTELTSREPGVIAYEWSLSEDRRRLHVYERYVDSEAGLAHLANAGPELSKLLDIVSLIEIECYGPASDDLRTAIKDFPLTFLQPFEGFHR
ncbi:MAG: putative quinol monooxygenase [Pseudomonadales bacterium]|jgi:quinol monooxygenase YgiN